MAADAAALPEVAVISAALAQFVLLLAAGALAGAAGSAGGTASLISYPALLVVGVPPFQANVTNAVAFVASWPGSALGSRTELRGRGRWLLRWGLLAAAGASVGAALLLLTPSAIFGRVVPYLVAFAALALLFQPRIRAWQARHPRMNSPFILPAGLLAASVYNGYWGAGAGVMLLAVMLMAVDQHLPRANALKNMLLGFSDIVAASAFVLFGPVDWAAAAPLALGLFAGSTVGPAVTRRVPADALRVVVGLAGLGLAVKLWLSPG
ncbi:MAG: sulfite exporter TauE/SafE family protein [Candidatus Limnocylindrales bacterium]